MNQLARNNPSRSARLRHLVVVSIVASSLAFGMTAIDVAPAHAASAGNVWVNFGPWNCPNAKVVGVYWAVDSYSVGPAGGDWGDNVIYPRVRIGANNTISYQVKCKRAWFVYNGVVGQRNLSPYKSGLSYTY